MTTAAALAGVLPPEALAAAPDAGRWSSLGVEPEAVVSPASDEEVVAVLEWAGSEGVRVLPAGSGRRLRRAAADRRFVVLTTERLTGFEIYEPADLTFTARAGTPLREVDERLRAHGQWLPFDPPAFLDRTLGGLVAAGDSGPLWMGYGAIRNHLLGLTAVTGDGRVLSLGGRVVKNVAGFDVLKALVGSRGRLAVVTSVCLRAFPRPAVDRLFRVRGGAPEELAPLALGVGTAPVLPVSCVLTADHDGEGGAALTVRLHGSEATVDADRRRLEEHLGRPLERLDGGASSSPVLGGAAVPGWTGDGPGAAAVEVVLSFLPSRLAEVVDALSLVDASSVSIDTYAARARLGLRTFDAAALGALRGVVESLGGALSLERAPAASDGAQGVATTPSADERELEERVARVFDPGEVLWR